MRLVWTLNALRNEGCFGGLRWRSLGWVVVKPIDSGGVEALL